MTVPRGLRAPASHRRSVLSALLHWIVPEPARSSPRATTPPRPLAARRTATCPPRRMDDVDDAEPLVVAGDDLLVGPDHLGVSRLAEIIRVRRVKAIPEHVSSVSGAGRRADLTPAPFCAASGVIHPGTLAQAIAALQLAVRPTVRHDYEPLVLGGTEDFDFEAARGRMGLQPDLTEIDRAPVSMPALMPPPYQLAMCGDIPLDEACRSIHEAGEQFRSGSHYQQSALDGTGCSVRTPCSRRARHQDLCDHPLSLTGQLHRRPCSRLDVPRQQTGQGDSRGSVGRQPKRPNQAGKEPEDEDASPKHAAKKAYSHTGLEILDRALAQPSCLSPGGSAAS